MAHWGYLYLNLLFGSAVVTSLMFRQAPGVGFLRSKSTALLAKLSYSLYLVHPATLGLVFAFAGQALVLNSFINFGLIVISLVLSLGVSALLYVLIERHCIRFGHTFSYAHRPSLPNVAKVRFRPNSL
jgi:peptidoglycan/LPS O-acetylase OafA/YrhL